MTSPVAVTDLTFSATDITDLTGIMLERIDRGGPGTLATVAGSDDPLPGADGVFPRNRRKRTRMIELAGYVFGVGTDAEDQIADFWNNRVALEALFTPSTRDDITATLRNGSTYRIEAWPVTVDYGPMAPSMASVSIVLESTEADWELVGS